MSAVRHQACYNGITFNQVYSGTDPGDPDTLDDDFRESDYRLEYFDDSMVSVRDLSEPRQMMEGTETNDAFEVVRVLRGAGRILGATYGDLEDKVWEMREAFALSVVRARSTFELVDHLPDEPVGVLPFDFTRDTIVADVADTLDLRYYARPLIGRPSIVVAMKGGLVRPFEFQLVCHDPRAYVRYTGGGG